MAIKGFGRAASCILVGSHSNYPLQVTYINSIQTTIRQTMSYNVSLAFHLSLVANACPIVRSALWHALYTSTAAKPHLPSSIYSICHSVTVNWRMIRGSSLRFGRGYCGARVCGQRRKRSGMAHFVGWWLQRVRGATLSGGVGSFAAAAAT
jgi:hypothetical protein